MYRRRSTRRMLVVVTIGRLRCTMKNRSVPSRGKVADNNGAVERRRVTTWRRVPRVGVRTRWRHSELQSGHPLFTVKQNQCQQDQQDILFYKICIN